MAVKRQKFAKAKLTRTIEAVASDVDSTRDATMALQPLVQDSKNSKNIQYLAEKAVWCTDRCTKRRLIRFIRWS